MTSVSNAKKLATWHAIVLISDALTVTIMDIVAVDCPDKIPPSGTSAQCRDNTTSRCEDQHLGIIATPGIPTMTIETGTDSIDLDLAHITPDIGVTVTVILAEAILDHFTGPHAIALCATGAQAHTTTAMTHHIADPHHAEISPKMTVDPEYINPTSTTTNPHKDNLPVHNQHPGSLRIEGTNRLQLMIHPQNIIALMNKTAIQRMI